MKFDELCEHVLIGEADYDTLTGKSKVFSLADGAEEVVQSLGLNDVKDLIRKTTLPFDTKFLVRFVADDLTNYLPAETADLKKMLKRSIWAEFDESEKKSGRAAAILFAWLKKKKIIAPGIPKKDDKDEIESLAKELETDVADADYSTGLSVGDVGKLGGSVPRSGASEDESQWY